MITKGIAKVKSAETILSDLQDAADRIDGYCDVRDGDYGTVMPNDAMIARQLLQEVIDELPALLRRQVM